ncbi:MAG TPA: hypothetical protein GXX36_01840 [Clostridiaceae bacterium]|nr:hypothetical protein [Clostridiaceae bacterium]
MKIKRQKVMELMDTYCNGNYNRFGRELGIDPSHLYRFINKGIGGGKKLAGAVIKFCKVNSLDFEDYIEL